VYENPAPKAEQPWEVIETPCDQDDTDDLTLPTPPLRAEPPIQPGTLKETVDTVQYWRQRSGDLLSSPSRKRYYGDMDAVKVHIHTAKATAAAHLQLNIGTLEQHKKKAD
jgi:hypothetical protein